METRSASLHGIRPQLNRVKELEGIKSEEWFQNTVLRPILKLQNDLLVAVFKNYIVKHKNVFNTLNNERKLRYIEQAIQKDMKFRNALKGMVIGLFTVEEYMKYCMDSSALNKRMMQMIIERLKDQMQLLETPGTAN
jgi:hypothetical protein